MLQLYTYFRSSAAYRVRIALNLKGLAYEAIPVHLVRDGGQQHQAAFTALNPNALVPVLRDGDANLTQSLAIIEYLDEQYPDGPALMPQDALGRARVRALAQTIACEIHPVNNLRVLKHLEQHHKFDAAAKQAWYQHWVTTGFDAVETMLTNSPATGLFCHGNTPTLADCCLVPQVFNAERFAVPMDAYPRIQAITQHCRSLPAFQHAAPEAQPDAE